MISCLLEEADFELAATAVVGSPLRATFRLKEMMERLVAFSIAFEEGAGQGQANGQQLQTVFNREHQDKLRMKKRLCRCSCTDTYTVVGTGTIFSGKGQ